MSGENLYYLPTKNVSSWLIGIVSVIFIILGAFLWYAIASAVRLHAKLEKIMNYVPEEEQDEENLITIEVDY